MQLRIAVEGGGCSGFQYTFNMEDPKSKEMNKQQGGEEGDGGEVDLLFGREDAKDLVVVDSTSFGYIKGATVDYVQEMIKSAL